MVSNTLDMDLQELLETLKRLSEKQGDSAEYQKLRRELPEDWPI